MLVERLRTLKCVVHQFDPMVLHHYCMLAPQRQCAICTNWVPDWQAEYHRHICKGPRGQPPFAEGCGKSKGKKRSLSMEALGPDQPAMAQIWNRPMLERVLPPREMRERVLVFGDDWG